MSVNYFLPSPPDFLTFDLYHSLLTYTNRDPNSRFYTACKTWHGDSNRGWELESKTRYQSIRKKGDSASLPACQGPKLKDGNVKYKLTNSRSHESP